jgi:hypothetical protein
MASRQDCGDRDSVLLRRPDVGALRGVAMNRAKLLLALLSPQLGSWGCGGPAIPPEVAQIAEPKLRVLGFCQRNGAESSEVAALNHEYKTGDKVNAA